jgi:hypothetical protein
MLLVLALVAAATAGYLETQTRTSYSGYSEEQLAALEQELGQHTKKKGREADSIFIEQRLQEEHQRRANVRLAMSVAGGLGLAAVASFLLSGLSALRARRDARREQQTMSKAYGGFGSSSEEAREKAAALLGVSVNAPPAVIEAALEAHLKERDLSRMDGLAPDLQQMMMEQREALVRARNLLIGRSW